MIFFDYLAQRLGHFQHGIGQFEFQSKKQHEKYRREMEAEHHCIWCNCEDCDKNRKLQKNGL